MVTARRSAALPFPGALFLSALLLAACATGGPREPSASPAEGPLRTVLANGVVLIAQEQRASDVVALQLWFRVGGRVESADELGLSHYIEHMIFKGTPTRPVGSIDRLVEGLGGTSNAYTSYDYVHFDVVLPAREVRAGIELLADIAANASFPTDEITSEKKVVFEEMSVLEDDPDKALVRRLYELGYEPYPYGRPILGTRKDIEGLTRDQLVRYYKKYYVPRNTVLVIVGAVKPAAVVPMVEAAFGKLTGGEGKGPALSAAPALDSSRRRDVRRPEKQAYLGMAWRAPAVADDDVFAVDLLTYILGDSPSSRLNRVLRDQENLVDAIEAGYGAWQSSGLATVTARMEPANLDRAEASIRSVLRRVREEGVTEAERQRAIVSAESLYAFDIETAEGLAKTYGQAEVTYSLKDELLYLSRLRQITAAQIQAAARKYFGDDNYARVRFVPIGVGGAWTPPSPPIARGATRGSPGTRRIRLWAGDGGGACSPAAALLVALVAAPAAGADGVRVERLDNGFTVLVRENAVAPVVALCLLVRMGTRWETPDNAGISNFLQAVMVTGTARRSGGELADAVTALGGKLSASGDLDYSEIRASALARFWRELLELTAELALQPKLAPAEVDRERAWLIRRVQRRFDNPVSRAFDGFYGLVYGAYPYALPTLGTPESLPRIDHAAIVERYRAFYRPERMVLAVSGQVPASDVVAEVKRLFGISRAVAPWPIRR